MGLDDAVTPATSVIPYSVQAFLVLLATVAAFVAPVFVVFPPTLPRPSDALEQTHDRIGIVPQRTKAKSAALCQDGQASVPKISSLVIYPVKSCQGIEVKRSKVIPAGLEFDRILTFAVLKDRKQRDGTKDETERTWDFITQREYPLLATVEVELWRPNLAKQKRRMNSFNEKSGENFVVIRFPSPALPTHESLATRLHNLISRSTTALTTEVVLPTSFSPDAYPLSPIRIWKDTILAQNLESELPPSLATYLGIKQDYTLGLFHILDVSSCPADGVREVHRCAPTKDEVGYQPTTGFQDAYPLHLLCEESVRELEKVVDTSANDVDHLVEGLDVRKFRANIILSSVTPYDEDSWKHITFTSSPSQRSLQARAGLPTEKSSFHVSCRTVRCKMPNIDQDTGHRHTSEPDTAIRKYREIDEGALGHGCLGMQLTPLFERNSGTGEMELESWLEVGMECVVERRGEHRYIKQ